MAEGTRLERAQGYNTLEGLAILCDTDYANPPYKNMAEVERFELPTPALEERCSNPTELHLHILWCLEFESNKRHLDFQSSALTYLSYLGILYGGW